MKINRLYRKSTIPKHAKCVFEGVLFDVYQWEQELYDGSTTTFEKLVRDDTVLIIPILSDGRLVLTHDEQPGRDAYITAPGGRIDPGETPEGAVRRELLEETGYTVESLTLLQERKPEEKIDWMVYTFLGKGAQRVTEPNPGPGERADVLLVTVDEFIDLGVTGRLHSEWKFKLIEAKLNPQKMAELRTLLAP